MILIAEKDFDTKILADSAVLQSQCEGTDCNVQTLSLYDRPR